jgi:hypothetical protein
MTTYPNSMVRRGNVVDADTGNVDSDLTGRIMNQLIMITHILNRLTETKIHLKEKQIVYNRNKAMKF